MLFLYIYIFFLQLHLHYVSFTSPSFDWLGFMTFASFNTLHFLLYCWVPLRNDLICSNPQYLDPVNPEKHDPSSSIGATHASQLSTYDSLLRNKIIPSAQHDSCMVSSQWTAQNSSGNKRSIHTTWQKQQPRESKLGLARGELHSWRK